MAIIDLFSKRGKPLPEVYVYDTLTDKLRTQLTHILVDLIDITDEIDSTDALYRMLLREWGRHQLSTHRSRSSGEELAQYIATSASVEEVLDTLELFCSLLKSGLSQTRGWKRESEVDDIAQEINSRFRSEGFGFEYANGQFNRIDSQVAHQQIVKPTLALLTDPVYQTANQEYLLAHEHFRHGRFQDCLVACCRSFESTMKIICSQKGWTYNQTDTASTLIRTLESNGLFPTFLSSHINNFTSLLTGTVPTVRNKLGGHGAGTKSVDVEEEWAAFLLHSTASDILLLVKLAS